MVKDANNELWNFELTGFLEDYNILLTTAKGKRRATTMVLT